MTAGGKTNGFSRGMRAYFNISQIHYNYRMNILNHPVDKSRGFQYISSVNRAYRLGIPLTL